MAISLASLKPWPIIGTPFMGAAGAEASVTEPSSSAASPQQTGPTTLNQAWSDFVAHLPTMVLIWLTTVVLTGLGAIVYTAVAAITAALSSGQTSNSDIATALGMALGQIGQLPFTLLSALVGVLISAVPALYYQRGSNISIETAFRTLLQRPWRYLAAGVLYAVALTFGSLLCVLPGIAVGLVGPIYVNLVFNGSEDVGACFTTAFQRVYGSERGRHYAFSEVLAWLAVVTVSVCTCGLGGLIAIPVASFYLQQLAYQKELV